MYPDPDPGQLITNPSKPEPQQCFYSTSKRKRLLILTFPTGGTFGGKNAVEVVDTVDLVVKVHREGDPVQAVVADAASVHKQFNFSH